MQKHRPLDEFDPKSVIMDYLDKRRTTRGHMHEHHEGPSAATTSDNLHFTRAKETLF